MNDRRLVDRTLQGARLMAYDPGEFVGQESFMCASEILALAEKAGVGPGVSVLDLCCGVAGPGRFLTREFGCAYLGVDSSPDAVDIARDRAADLDCRFEVARVPPLPSGQFDVVLLLETMLAFPDKEDLLRAVSAALSVDGRFAFTMEAGLPLTESEKAAMPGADTVWLVPSADLVRCLERVGLEVRWQEDHSESHLAVVDALIAAFAAEASGIVAGLGPAALDRLLVAHQLWSSWLRAGRVRKLAFVAEKAVRLQRTTVAC